MSGGGDTPSKTLWYYQLGPGFNLAGRIVDNGGEFKETQVYGPQENVIRVYTDQGEALSTNTLSSAIQQDIALAIQETFGFQVDPVVWVMEPVGYQETLPNWDSYEKVTKP